MTIILSQQEHKNLQKREYQTLSQQTGESECYINYPEQVGHAYHWSIDLCPGVKLAIKDHYFNQPLIIKQPEREHPIELNFCLSGSQGDSVFDFVTSGTSRLFGNGICPQGELTCFQKQRFLVVDLHIKPEAFETLLLGDSPSYPEGIKLILQDRREWLNMVSGEITAEMELVLQQILNCPYNHSFKQLYLESKALELISLQLAELFDSPSNRSKQLKLSDYDCIYQARDILDKSLHQAPTLRELARQVGLNEEKLTKGFEQMFHTTPFQYLRDRRLEQAKHLLRDTNQSVEEVAQTIGYANRSKFAVAFRQKFGVNPKSFQLQSRCRYQKF